MGILSAFRTALAGAFAAALLPAVPAAAVDIQELESPGGVSFWLVEEPSIPIVAVEMSFKGGAVMDPEDRPGLAQMVASLMDEGAGERDTVAFSNAADALAARFSFSAGREAMEVSARMLAENAPASAALLSEALSAPRFDADPMARVRGQMLSRIAETETDPQERATLAWYARAFPGHPYGRPVIGTAESVAAITREELVAAHQRLYTKSNATVAIVGAVSAEEAAALVDTMLGALPEGEPVPEVTDAQAPPPGIEVIELDVPQSVAIFGHEGLPREDEQFFAAFVMNHILGGGGFSARLMTEVREKRGLAYGVYSYFRQLEGAKLHLGSVQTANARMAESLEVIRAEWARMRDGGVSEDELADAKKYLTGAFPLRFDSNAKIAGYLVFMQTEGLGADYLDTRNARIEAVTREEIAAVAERLLDPEALSITVVGKPVGL